MARKKIPKRTSTRILLKSRRRCAICFGLNRDTDIKSGQIAHLDKDRSNNSEGNLAFVCLEHHDEYDSRTSQRKGFVIEEVKAFRQELYEAVGKSFSMQVHFGDMALPHTDPYAGQYIRMGDGQDSAEIDLTPLPDNMEGLPRYAVTGIALFGTRRPSGPNIGDVEFIGTLVDGAIIFSMPPSFGEGASYCIKLAFRGRNLTVKEENYFGMYGIGVHFNGKYKRA